MHLFTALRRIAGVALHVLHGAWVAHVRLRARPPAERHAAVQWWSAALVRKMGVELRIAGTPRPGAVLLVSNHVSWLDIPALHAAHPQARFVSKAAVAHWPVLGGLARTASTLFIERERKRDAMRVVHEVAGALAQGDAIAVFPEGTTGPGDAVLPFHANLLQAAISSGVAVQPIAIRYSEPGHAVSVAVRYVGGTTLIGSVLRLAGARGVVAHVRFLEPVEGAQANRRALAASLQALVAARLAEDQAGAGS